MADTTRITVPASTEPTTYFRPSLMSLRFTALLPLLSAHIEAERDLAHVDRWDTAFTGWLTEAERSRSDLDAALNELCCTEVVRLEDKPLKRVSLLIRALLASEDAAEFVHLHSLPLRMPDLFRCAGERPVAVRINLLLDEALSRIDALAALPDYLDPVEDEAEAPVEKALAPAL